MAGRIVGSIRLVGGNEGGKLWLVEGILGVALVSLLRHADKAYHLERRSMVYLVGGDGRRQLVADRYGPQLPCKEELVVVPSKKQLEICSD